MSGNLFLNASLVGGTQGAGSARLRQPESVSAASPGLAAGAFGAALEQARGQLLARESGNPLPQLPRLAEVALSPAVHVVVAQGQPPADEALLAFAARQGLDPDSLGELLAATRPLIDARPRTGSPFGDAIAVAAPALLIAQASMPLEARLGEATLSASRLGADGVQTAAGANVSAIKLGFGADTVPGAGAGTDPEAQASRALGGPSSEASARLATHSGGALGNLAERAVGADPQLSAGQNGARLSASGPLTGLAQGWVPADQRQGVLGAAGASATGDAKAMTATGVEAVFRAQIDASSELGVRRRLQLAQAQSQGGAAASDQAMRLEVDLGREAERWLARLLPQAQAPGSRQLAAAPAESGHAADLANPLASRPAAGGGELRSAGFAQREPVGLQASLFQAQEEYLQLSRRVGEVMAQRLAGEFQRGNWSLQMQLHPAQLGAVGVRMALNEGALRAQITASSALARDLIVEGLPRLRMELEQAGLQLGDVQVGLAQDQSGGQRHERALAARAPLSSAPELKPVAATDPGGPLQRKPDDGRLDVLA